MKLKHLTLAASMLLLMAACKKEMEEGANIVSNTEMLSAEEEVLFDADMTFLDELSTNGMESGGGSIAERTSDEWITGQVADSLPGEPCAIRTWRIIDSLHRVLTIDFGSTPCLCRDSLYRKGMIIIHYEGRRDTPGFKRTITHRDYFVNRNKIEGKITITYQGNFRWTRTLENGLIIYPDATRASRQSRHMIEQVEGMRTPGLRGDVFKIMGSASGINRRGVRYVSNIREPLIRKYEPGCARVFIKGIVVTKTGDGNEAILNYDPYGSAPCDRIASLTINGETRIIRL